MRLFQNIKAVLLFTAILLIIGCSGEPPGDPLLTTTIGGRITVDEGLDNSGNYSGIELLVSAADRFGNGQDTLFYAVTDVDGYFSGTATIEESDVYPVLVSRNRNIFGIINMVFANGDSITFNGELPDLSGTAELLSPENDTYRTFERLERSFGRVAQFINAGVLSADSVEIELNKWSNLFWEVHEKHPGTYASQLAGETSLALLNGWNDSLMVERKESLLSREKKLLSGTRTMLIDYYAETEGLGGALVFLDRLEDIAPTNRDRMNIQIDRVEILYDSSRTEEALQRLNQIKKDYSEDGSTMAWAENMAYDLEVLVPGTPFPAVRFQTVEGDSMGTDQLAGRPFLLEISRLDNRLFQEQYEQSMVIHQIYHPFGLEIITVPLAATEVTLEAFFEERERLWHIVQPNSFDEEGLIEKLNINHLPVRFLVDAQGNLIRRYVGMEYDDIVHGLQRLDIEFRTDHPREIEPDAE